MTCLSPRIGWGVVVVADPLWVVAVGRPQPGVCVVAPLLVCLVLHYVLVGAGVDCEGEGVEQHWF